MRLADIIGVGTKPLVFNPYLLMRSQIAAASRDIASHFDEIDTSLDKGTSVKTAVRQSRGLRAVMNRVIASARITGFQHGAAHSKKKMPPVYGRKVQEASEQRAKKVNRMMRRTTRRVLRKSPDSSHVLSKDRAVAAARFEAAQAYFQGVKDAFKDTDFEKSWITSAAEPCEDCQGNEEDGPIDVGDVFSSGHEYPAAHLNCACSVLIKKAK